MSNPFPKNMKKTAVWLSLVFCLVLAQKSMAQDKHFTQFYAAPLTLNPALTGAFEGKYRVASTYRDQWRSVLDFPIRTYALAADLRFAPPGRKKIKQDAIGLGMMFFNDKVSVIDFSTTQIAVSMAYHKALDTDNRQFLTVGVQGGVTQRNVNYETLRFHDQFNGSTGYVKPTQEDLPPNNFSYGDLNIGLNYTAAVGRSGKIFTGLAYHHANRPNVSFYANNNNGSKLYPKYSGQFAANIPLRKDNRVSLLPRFLVASQGPHMEVNAGTNFRVAMGKYGGSAVHFGTWVRPVRDQNSFGMDAVVALFGLEFNKVLLGMSYDLSLKGLSANQRQGAFEISIAYLGNYENEEIICPKF